MLDSSVFREISDVFIGDTQEKWYSYKTGPQLVAFFNQYFDYQDMYAQGFPTRWKFVHDKLVGLVNCNKIDTFFNIILSKEYYISDKKVSEVEAVTKLQEIHEGFNKILRPYSYMLMKKENKYNLSRIDEDLKFIGTGGFANVYLQRSTGYIVKKLKEDFVVDVGIKSRFKREYEITKSLQDIDLVIKIIDFDSNTYSYRMEKAETTLKKYILDHTIEDPAKITIVRQIMYVMELVHSREIIHRDLSPTNIFVVNGLLKIADFGLGKDLNIFSSHQTVGTNGVGQYWYCAPEQFMCLKEGDKRSDVYSLGRLVNFIMAGDPTKTNHPFKNITEKATNENPVSRFPDAGKMKESIEKNIKYYADARNEQEVLKKMKDKIFEEDVEFFLANLSEEKICKMIMENVPGFNEALLHFMKEDERRAQNIIQSIKNEYIETAGYSFKNYDPFACFAYDVLRHSGFLFSTKECAATILYSIANELNRFDAQRLVQSLLDEGIEPMIEEVLR